MCLGENLERKTERIYLENAPNWLIFNYLFLFEWHLGVFILKRWLFSSNDHLVAANLEWLDGGLPGLDWIDLDVSRKLLMCSFWNTKELENPMIGSKVMALRSEMTHFARFSRYFNCFNFDFNLWIVVRKRTQ